MANERFTSPFVRLLLFIAALLAVNVLAGPPRRQNTNRNANVTVECEDIDRLDEASREYALFGDRAHNVPYNLNEATNEKNGHCPRFRRAEQVIRAYARKCFKPFAKQVIGLIVYGSAKELKRRCDSDEGIREFIENGQCSKGQNYEPVHMCMDTYIRQLEGVRDNVEDLDLKLPYSCCYYYRFKQCVVRELKRFCDKTSVEYVEGIVQRSVEDALDLTCKNYEENSSNCGKLAEVRTPVVAVSKSFIPPLVDIYTNL